jgi:hypothetical protein
MVPIVIVDWLNIHRIVLFGTVWYCLVPMYVWYGMYGIMVESLCGIVIFGPKKFGLAKHIAHTHHLVPNYAHIQRMVLNFA